MHRFGQKVRLRYNDDVDDFASCSSGSDGSYYSADNSTSESESDESSDSSSSSSSSGSGSCGEVKAKKIFKWGKKKAKQDMDDNATTFSIQSSLSRVSESVSVMMEQLDSTFDSFMDSMIASESDSESSSSVGRGPSFVKRMKEKIMSPMEVHMKMTTVTPKNIFKHKSDAGDKSPKYNNTPGERTPVFQSRTFSFNKSPPANQPPKKSPFSSFTTLNTPRSTKSVSSVRSNRTSRSDHVPFSTRSTNSRRPFSTRSFSNRSRPSSTKSASSLGRTFKVPSSTRSYQERRKPEKRFTFDGFNHSAEPEPMPDSSKNELNFFKNGFNTALFSPKEKENSSDPFGDLDSLATPPENQGAFWNDLISFMHEDKVPSEITFEGEVQRKKCFFPRGGGGKKNRGRFNKKFAYTSLG